MKKKERRTPPLPFWGNDELHGIYVYNCVNVPLYFYIIKYFDRNIKAYELTNILIKVSSVWLWWG